YNGPPAFEAVDTGERTDRRFSAGGRGSQQRGRHALQFGADVDLARSSASPRFAGSITELVDTMASRVWTFGSTGRTSRRSATTLAGFLGDTLAVNDHSTVDVSVRIEHLSASADGATQGIGWTTVLPRAMYRTSLSAAHHVDFFVGGGISAYQVPLDV